MRGYRVVLAHSGRGAVERTREAHPELILMDPDAGHGWTDGDAAHWHANGLTGDVIYRGQKLLPEP